MKDRVKEIESFGHTLFSLSEKVLELPVMREKQYLSALGDYEYKMSQVDLTLFMEGVKNAATKNDMSRVIYLAQTVQNCSSLAYSDMCLFNVAAPLILVDDEKLNKPTLKHLRLKEELFWKDNDVHNFFLQYGNHLIKRTENSPSDTSILEYLQRRPVKQTVNLYWKSLRQLRMQFHQSQKSDNEDRPQ